MLASVIFELAPRDVHGEFTGYHAYSWFMGAVRDMNPQVAAGFHGPSQGVSVAAPRRSDDGGVANEETKQRRKPFTLWVGPRFGFGPEGITREPDDRYWLRVTCLDSVGASLLARLVAAPPDPIRLGVCQFSAARVFTDSTEHPWSGAATFGELEARWRDGRPPARLTLRFLSPTTFRGAPVRFPTADLVFKSLLRRWNEHSPAPSPRANNL